eukprot:TRINITY_DN1780_c0_g2_i1.p1 TRINITY_DN1780_c0_g2~~TRINITY_DN1780_c0_g2_i1.p1  ORF type:complete len:441 (+),score=116.58 TRINITY_DN1780_c0_g2_i1:54-1376(+)
MSNISKAELAAKAMSNRAKGKKSNGELKKKIMVGLGIIATIAALWLAWTDPGSGKKRALSTSLAAKATAYVNDRYFVSDVTSYAAGNFTAAASPFFNSWTYADVTYGLDGVGVKGEGMIGFAGALQRCPHVDESLETGAVPPAYDLREQAPSCAGGEVYNQGNCSSSHAIAAATSLGSRFCVSDQDKYGNTRLSPQQVLSCDKKSQGCKGGGIDAVWSYIERRGLFPESCVPFAGGKDADCKSDCAPEQKLKAIEHCMMSGAKNIKREVYNRGPVVAPMYLKDDFMVYKGGVYTPTDNANMQFGADGQPIQHAVTIMGWGRFEGTPYWIVKNSWGTTWGEDGWARVAISSGAIREEAVIVGAPATPEALAAEEKRKEEEAIRKEELKKERAERDARIREREAARAAEEAEKLAAQEDLDFEDDEELDLDADTEEDVGDDP